MAEPLEVGGRKSAYDEVNEECPIKQVDLTVPKTDDPTLPMLTFRMWVLGIASCVILSFVNQFFWYRKNPLSVSSISAQIAVVPIGHFMARVLPNRVFFKDTRFEFSLNPGPFNIKEHVLITIFANSGAGSVYAAHILSAVKLIYKRSLPFLPAFLVMLTTQASMESLQKKMENPHHRKKKSLDHKNCKFEPFLIIGWVFNPNLKVLGFGWAGVYRKMLVEPAEMWWPSNLIQVSLFSALHEKGKRPRGGTTRSQFFLLVLICSFAYYVFPGYFFPLLTSFSWICWVAPNSVLFQQLGSGANGLGIGAFGFDWTTIASYLGSPLASPWFATANVAVGFFLIMYVMNPIAYWLNAFGAKKFPIFSQDLFLANGSYYNVSTIVDSNFHLDRDAYAKTGRVHLSTFFALTYGVGFATLSATVVHVLLFHGSEIWKHSKRAFGDSKKMDIHTRLMKKYKSVPGWWFHIILVGNIALTIFTCEYYKASLQLPWWGVLLACAIAIFFTLPIGIISATTNQQPGLNIITEYVFGYLYPERPVANMCFKVYGYISMVQALTFLADFKLGHYMKIPPRTMFMAQVVGTVLAVLVYTLTAWWLMGTIPNLCDVSKLPANSPWTCPMDNVFYDASVIWGLVGPRRIFGNLGEYPNVNWFFLGGAIAPLLVWLAHKAFPSQTWIGLIHMPVLLGATSMMPPATAVNFTSWIIVGFLSGYVAYRYRPEWWKRYNYVLSGGLDAGTAFMTIFLFIALGSQGIGLDWWGNDPNYGDRCPLAPCPTAKGVFQEGCPVQ